MQAAILAGGKGERMRVVSETPKPMLPLNGKPILEHQIEWLKNAGFKEIFLCLGYQSDVFRSKLGDGSRWGVSLDYRIEAAPRGTAGAVRDLGSSLKGDILLIYGDLYVEMDLKGLLDFHAQHGAAATLVVRRTDHAEDSDLVKTDGSGRITAICRQDSGKVTGDLACAAIWIVSPALLDYAPLDSPSDFARDIFPKALADGKTLMAYVTEETVADVGTPERYSAWQRRLG